ncbi:unnamed protein product, partial [Rangifer tarandus platyrhynchus]
RAPARAGRVCTARQRAAPAGQRRALTPGGPPLITPAPAPRRLPAPRVPAAAHLALAAREDRGWPSPGSGLVSPPPAGWRRRAPLAQPSSSEELAPPLAGVCVCRASRPRAPRSPGRSEAAAAAAGGGFLRCGPSRFPRTSAAAGTPGPPPLRPASRPTALPGAPLPAPGGGQWGLGARSPAPGESPRASIPKLVWLPGGGGRVWPLRGR